MPLRDVVIEADTHETVGDETYELWLKRPDVDWELYSTGAVETPTQQFEMLGLESDELHVVQLRMKREGRYRIGYLAASPDDWPVQSRLEFTPTIDSELGVPTVNSATWSRTSGVSERITVSVTPDPDGLEFDIELLRNGVVVATQAGPHGGGPINIVDLDCPGEQSHSYRARHVAPGGLEGNLSNTVTRWAGPDKPTNFEQTNDWIADPITARYHYDVGWDAPAAGATTTIQDDYLCPDVYDNESTTSADATSAGKNVEQQSLSVTDYITASFGARARHNVTQFGETDNSDWSSAPITVMIKDDETAFDSCP